MKLIIDTDPGIDDAMAYFYAHASSGIDLIALTTIFGNVTIEDAARNALWLTEFTNAKTNVYRGVDSPLAVPPKPPTREVHGDHGFGTFVAEQISRTCEDESAADFMVRIAAQQPGEIVLCALGPLTNVALAVEKDPKFVGNLKRLVLMGGALRSGGNVTQYAEANFWHDPNAADVVLNAPGGGEIVIVGLDVTHQISIGPDNFQKLAEVAPRTGAFIQKIADFYLDFYESRKGERSVYLHDPAAIIACVRPELFTTEKHRLSVIVTGEKSGMMVATESGTDADMDSNAARQCLVCTDVEADRVLAEFEQIAALNA